MVFIFCISLMIKDEHFFIYLLAFSVSSLEKQKSSSSNIDWVGSIFAIEFQCLLYKLCINPFIRYMDFHI